MKPTLQFGLAAAIAVSAAIPGALARDLPLGDGKVSSSAKAGYVYSCQTRFPSSGQGAQRSGAWLNETAKTWNPDLKPIIDGSVSWPGKISISLDGDTRVVSTNSLPNHKTGTYPIGRSDDAYAYDRNPNKIKQINTVLRLPANPEPASKPTCLPMGIIGFATSGAAIFNALDALGRDAPAHEIQDRCNGHPERSGQYHYHDYSKCLAEGDAGPDSHSGLLGYALDGFGIYGEKMSGGKAVSSRDLDRCHGHVEKVMWDGKVVEMYHYHFSEDYPYTLGCFTGKVTN